MLFSFLVETRVSVQCKKTGSGMFGSTDGGWGWIVT